MNKKEFLTVVVSKLSEYFNRLGFAYKSSYNGFVKDIEDGWICVSFDFYKSAGLGNFVVGIQVRKNVVQNLLFKYVEINPADQAKAPTFGTTLHKFLEEKENAYRFETEAQLNGLLDQSVIPFLENDLPEFAAKYADLQNLYFLFADRDEPNNRLVWPTYYNYIEMLLMGWILNPNELDYLVRSCNELFIKLKGRWPEQLDVELYENNFGSIAQDLKKANGDLQKVGSYWSTKNKG